MSADKIMRDYVRMLRDRGGEYLEMAGDGTHPAYVDALTKMAHANMVMADWLEGQPCSECANVTFYGAAKQEFICTGLEKPCEKWHEQEVD